MFDPWKELAKHPHIEVRFERLDDSVVGLTDGVSRIWLDDRLNQVERRCVLTHELGHIARGHRTCQPLRIEMEVCLEASRKLISLKDLGRAVPWSHDIDELAEELWVTPQTLRDRLMGLRFADRQYLVELGVDFDMTAAA